MFIINRKDFNNIQNGMKTIEVRTLDSCQNQNNTTRRSEEFN